MTASVPADHLAPAWLRRMGAISWRLLAIAGLAAVTIWVSVLLGTVTVSVLLALIVAATFEPMLRRLRARGWSATKASAVVTVLALLVAILTLGLLAIAFIPELASMSRAVQAGMDELRSQLAAVSVSPAIGAQLESAVEGIESWLGSGLSGLVEALSFAVSVAVLSIFLTYFVLEDGERAWIWLLQFTTATKRERIDASGRAALDRVGGYLRATAIVSAARAASYAAFLWILVVCTACDTMRPSSATVVLRPAGGPRIRADGRG